MLIDLFFIHNLVQSLFCLDLLLGGVLILEQSFDRFLFCVADQLHLVQDLGALLLEGRADAAVKQTRVRREDYLGGEREVLSHESLTFKFAVEPRVLLVQRQRYRVARTAIIRKQHSIDSLLQDRVAVLNVHVLLGGRGHELDELPVLAFSAHDFDPVALVLPRLIYKFAI